MNFTPHPDYDNLPDAVKQGITAQEYAWMNDKQRETLIERECLPDYEGDD